MSHSLCDIGYVQFLGNFADGVTRWIWVDEEMTSLKLFISISGPPRTYQPTFLYNSDFENDSSD
jgi:hypothetical protein